MQELLHSPMPMSQYACAEAINMRAMQMEDFIVNKEGRKKRTTTLNDS